MSEIRYKELAQQGRLNIELAEHNMKALLLLQKRFSKEKPFTNLKIGMALHVTKETAVLVKTLVAGGAKVSITGCNPLSTQDDVAAALAEEDGVEVYAYKGESPEDYYRFLEQVVESFPGIVIDDGCDLVNLIVKKGEKYSANMLGGCEETTTGIIRLRAMEKDGALPFPLISVNDNKTKHLMDNYYGTGQSTLDGITRASNILWAGKVLVVAGYGSCGKGVALRGRGLGANVIVTEVNPFSALQAHMDGFRVMKMKDAAKLGDIFITLTGNKHVLRLEHMKVMKDGAILANSGHFDVEIDIPALEKAASNKLRVRPLFDEYTLNGKRLYLAGEGRLVNLACAEGHPSEVMSLSFCGQALACEYLVRNQGKLGKKVYTLPEEIDDSIARMQLDALQVETDQLTKDQQEYLADWREGT